MSWYLRSSQKGFSKDAENLQAAFGQTLGETDMDAVRFTSPDQLQQTGVPSAACFRVPGLVGGRLFKQITSRGLPFLLVTDTSMAA